MTSPVPPHSAARPGFPCPVCGLALVPGTRSCGRCRVDLTSAAAARLWQVEQQLAQLEGTRSALSQEASRLRAELAAAAARATSGASVGAASPAFPVPVLPGAPAAPARAPAAPAAGNVPAAGNAPAAGAPGGFTVPAPVPAGAPRPSTPAGAAGAGVPGGLAGIGLGSAPDPRPGRGIGGQQLLLGLGAFLLLSGVAFFLWIVWDLIGVGGQALVMLVLTGSAAASARWATVRRLPAAAETAAVIATGLLALDLSAAYRLGLFGLDRMAESLYFGLAGLGATAVLLGFDRMVPVERDGAPLRAIAVYRPLAALSAAAAAWSLADLTGDSATNVEVSAVMLAIGVAGCAVAYLAHRFDRRGPALDGLPVSVLLALLPAAPALMSYLMFSLAAGYGTGDGLQRAAGALLFALVPALLTLVAFRFRARRPSLARASLAVAAAGWCLVLGVPLWSAPRGLLAVLGVAAGAALVALVLAPAARVAGSWTRILAASLAGLSVALWLVLLVLDAGRAATMVGLLGDETSAGRTAWWLPVLPLLGVLAQRAVLLVRAHTDVNALLLQGTLLAGAVTALRTADGSYWMWTALVLALAGVGAAAVVASRVPTAVPASTSPATGVQAAPAPAAAPAGAPFAPARFPVTPATYPTGPAYPSSPASPARPTGPARTAFLPAPPKQPRTPSLPGAEWVHLGAAVVFTVLSLLGAERVSAGAQHLVCLVMAVAFAAHAARPGRLDVAFASVGLVSIATWVEAGARGATEVEAWTVVPGLALAVLGLLRYRAGIVRSSTGALGVALVVGLAPSVLVSVDGSDWLRTAWVTLAGVGLLLGGCVVRWRAMVVAGTLTLLVVGLARGGVLMEYVHGWTLLVGAGAVLLTAGVCWEASLRTARRGADWLASLR